jgi:hypothetical protein
VCGGVVDEVEGDMAIKQTKQMIRRNQRFEGEHFQTVLVRGRRLSMPRKDKAPSLWGLCQQSEAA